MSHMSHWIEDAEARQICRDAAFLTHIEQKQYVHLGAIVAKVAELWHHNVMDRVLHHGSSTHH
jgi:hypothetical protein